LHTSKQHEDDKFLIIWEFEEGRVMSVGKFSISPLVSKCKQIMQKSRLLIYCSSVATGGMHPDTSFRNCLSGLFCFCWKNSSRRCVSHYVLEPFVAFSMNFYDITQCFSTGALRPLWGSRNGSPGPTSRGLY